MRVALSGRVVPDAKRPPRRAGNQGAAAVADTTDNNVAHAIKEAKAKRAATGKRKRWTADEEEALRNGIKKCVWSPPLLSVMLTPKPNWTFIIGRWASAQVPAGQVERNLRRVHARVHGPHAH